MVNFCVLGVTPLFLTGTNTNLLMIDYGILYVGSEKVQELLNVVVHTANDYPDPAVS